MDFTGRDITIARRKGWYYATYRGHTANQNQRDGLEQYAIGRLVRLIFQLRTLLPDVCEKALGTFGLGVSTTRIQVISPYWGALSAKAGGVWNLASHPQGRDYSCEWNALSAIRGACLQAVAHGNAAVRNFLADDPDMRTLLNVNTALTGPLWTTDPDALVTIDTTVQASFPIDTRHDFPPYGGGDGAALLEAVDAAHFATAGGPEAETSVAVARAAYEDAAPNEHARWFRRLAYFEGLKDPGWNAVELDQWERLTHVYYRQWSDAQRTGNPRDVVRADHQHRLAHILLALGTHPALLVTMPDEDLDVQDYGTSYGGHQTGRQLLPKLVAKYGL